MIDEIKRICENYMNNRQPSQLVLGTYRGGVVYLDDNLAIPVKILSGAAISSLQEGDKVKMIRNDGGTEYCIIDIVNRDSATRIKTLEDNYVALEARVRALEARV